MFIAHMPERELTFSRKQKLYMADWGVVAAIKVTAKENKQLYVKEEVWHAKLAYEFVRNSGYPLLGEVVHLLTVGNICNVPTILPADVKRAYRIYRAHPGYISGQMVRKTVSQTHVTNTSRPHT
jgi:hypothetical protein